MNTELNDVIIKFIEAKETFNDEDKKYWIGLLLKLIESIPKLDDGKEYTLRMMFSDDFWQMDVAENHTVFGQLVAELVTMQLIPLEFKGKNHSNARQYQVVHK